MSKIETRFRLQAQTVHELRDLVHVLDIPHAEIIEKAVHQFFLDHEHKLLQKEDRASKPKA